MTDEINPVEQEIDNVGGDQQEDSAEEMKTTIAKLQADLAKQRSIAKKAIADRDTKKSKDSSEDDYKVLWERERDSNQKERTKRQNTEVESSLAEQLVKAGISKDALRAGIRLADKALVEWDADEGVDASSVTATVQKLKAQEAWMFETKVSKTDPKPAAGGSASNANEIKRSDFEKLSPTARNDAVMKGLKVVD